MIKPIANVIIPPAITPLTKTNLVRLFMTHILIMLCNQYGYIAFIIV